MANNNRLGELLVREKLISLSQLRHAQEEQQKSGREPRLHARQARLRHRRRDHQLLSPAVPRPDDQPRGVRDRRRDPQARPQGAVREAPGHPGLAHGQLAHRRDGRPDEPQRDRRPEVPHRLQHRAGHRERDRDPRGDREVLQRRPLVRRGDGRLRRDGDRVHRRRGGRQPPRAREGERGRAGRPARQHDPAQRHQEGRERHPHRAVREEAPRALPHRRRARTRR